MDNPGLHEYLEPHKEYIIRFKVNTEDEEIRAKLASKLFRNVLNKENFIEGMDVLSFYKQNYSEEELIKDKKNEVLSKILNQLQNEIANISIEQIDVNGIERMER